MKKTRVSQKYLMAKTKTITNWFLLTLHEIRHIYTCAICFCTHQSPGFCATCVTLMKSQFNYARAWHKNVNPLLVEKPEQYSINTKSSRREKNTVHCTHDSNPQIYCTLLPSANFSSFSCDHIKPFHKVHHSLHITPFYFSNKWTIHCEWLACCLRAHSQSLGTHAATIRGGG
jgi:hypothetical protein